MCWKARVIECTIQMQSEFWIVQPIALALLRRVSSVQELCFEYWNFRSIIHKLRIQAHIVFLVAFWTSRPPQRIWIFLGISIARRKCLCVSGKVVLWSKHFDIRMLVPMSYLQLCTQIKKVAYCLKFSFPTHW